MWEPSFIYEREQCSLALGDASPREPFKES